MDLPYYMNHQVWNAHLMIRAVSAEISLQWRFHHGDCIMHIQVMKE